MNNLTIKRVENGFTVTRYVRRWDEGVRIFSHWDDVLEYLEANPIIEIKTDELVD